MNSIRWMPMIRWLKFPFRVHILHKTVQLSVHELRGGYVCVCVKACPTVPPSPWEQGGEKTVFNIFLCFCISFFYDPWAVKSALFSKFCPIFVSYTWQLFWKICNSEPLHFWVVLMIGGDANNFLSIQNRKPQHSVVKKIRVKFQHGI